LLLEQLDEFLKIGPKFFVERMEIIYQKRKRISFAKQIRDEMIEMKENTNYQISIIKMLGRILENAFINEENIKTLFEDG